MTFLYWLFMFYLFSAMGWVIESVIESVCHQRPINRGSLWGPYIPIYGMGGVLFALSGNALKHSSENVYLNVFLVFFVGLSLATLLEYWGGSALERIFKKQFWDYSTLKLTYKFTYKNRISLVSSLFFGVLALFQAYILFDRVYPFTTSLNFYVLITINIVMTLCMGIDIIVQVRRFEHIQEFLEKLSYEQLRETLFQNMLRMARASQIREFRNAVFKNISENISENIGKVKTNVKTNVENIGENIGKVKSNVENIGENIKSKIRPGKTADDSGGEFDSETDAEINAEINGESD
ncbi:MAG: hypothetical protein FWF82_03295 [Oscillospiraceae bacterium]|nr:hypothetical protein [Oscillospiraceae bacterium]